MPGRDWASAFSSSVLTETVAGYGVISTSSMEYAVRVASMFRLMYGASLSGSDGETWNCCTTPGQSTPSRIAESTSSARPTDGSIQVRRKTLAKKSTAQISAMKVRISFDGSTALSSV